MAGEGLTPERGVEELRPLTRVKVPDRRRRTSFESSVKKFHFLFQYQNRLNVNVHQICELERLDKILIFDLHVFLLGVAAAER